MNYSRHSMILVVVAFCMVFVSTLRANSPASIEILGVKLTSKNQITVELEVKNLSNKSINIDSKMWVKQASLEGRYYYDDPELFRTTYNYYKPVITIYADITGQMGNWLGNMNFGGYPLPPLVLSPGEKTKIPVDMDMKWLLSKDLVPFLSKDIWMRAGLFQSGGKPTDLENQELSKQHRLLSSGDFTKVQDQLLSKYAPKEITHGTLYKLEMPKSGESMMGLEPISSPF